MRLADGPFVLGALCAIFSACSPLGDDDGGGGGTGVPPSAAVNSGEDSPAAPSSGFACSSKTGYGVVVVCTCVATPTATSPVGSCPGPLPEPICCADPSYPSEAGAACSCENYACTTPPDECYCSADSTGTILGPRCLAADDDDGGPCCLSTSPKVICQCGGLESCEGAMMEVPNCSVEILPCPNGKVRVPSCR